MKSQQIGTIGSMKGNMTNAQKLAFVSIIIAGSFGVQACQKAQAENSVTAMWENNHIVDESGLTLQLGTKVRGIDTGLTTFTSSDKLQSVGAFGSLPFAVTGTPITIDTGLGVDHYRESSDTYGNAFVTVGYKLAESVTAKAQTKYSHVFGNTDAKEHGVNYAFGITKTF